MQKNIIAHRLLHGKTELRSHRKKTLEKTLYMREMDRTRHILS